MKKLTTLLTVMMMCIALVACGGPDKQRAIDAYNSASDVYDKLVDQVNSDIDSYSQDLIDVMSETTAEMLEYKEILESNQELTEEQIDEMVEMFAGVEQWTRETEAGLDEWKIKMGDKQAVIDVFNETSTAFDELVDAINANIEAHSQETIDVMTQMSAALTQCKEVLESDKQLTEDEVKTLIEELTNIAGWVVEAKEALAAEAAGSESSGEAGSVDKQAVIDAFNAVSPMFDATATAVNANVDAFSDELVNTLIEVSGVMTEYKTILESDYALNQEEFDAMMESLTIIEQWLLEIESQVFG